MSIDIKYMELSQSKCKPCESGVRPLSPDEIESYKNDGIFLWDVIDNKKIVKDFKFDSYSKTMAFANKVAYLAEDEGHHPVMHIYFAEITIELWTHAIDGLSENDFIMAAKIDEIHV